MCESVFILYVKIFFVVFIHIVGFNRTQYAVEVFVKGWNQRSQQMFAIEQDHLSAGLYLDM
jgi:hypothetical protein